MVCKNADGHLTPRWSISELIRRNLRVIYSVDLLRYGAHFFPAKGNNKCRLRLRVENLVKAQSPNARVGQRTIENKNKPDRAKMRPDCVSACIDHVTYTERQMDEQTGETTE